MFLRARLCYYVCYLWREYFSLYLKQHVAFNEIIIFKIPLPTFINIIKKQTYVPYRTTGFFSFFETNKSFPTLGCICLLFTRENGLYK